MFNKRGTKADNDTDIRMSCLHLAIKFRPGDNLINIVAVAQEYYDFIKNAEGEKEDE